MQIHRKSLESGFSHEYLYLLQYCLSFSLYDISICLHHRCTFYWTDYYLNMPLVILIIKSWSLLLQVISVSHPAIQIAIYWHLLYLHHIYTMCNS